jgi:methionyl-tRNA synthetase
MSENAGPGRALEAGGSEPSGPARISIERFAEVELRTGRILEAAPHPDADRLLVMQVDVGESAPRQIVAGIRASWDPAELVGRTIVVVTNLQPAKLRGVESQGMLLAVRGTERILPLTVEGAVDPGTRVT